MQPSPPRLPLVVEVLCTADMAYGVVIEAHKLATDGRKSDALALLAHLADAVEAHRPILRHVIGAERQAAQAHDLTQRSDIRVLCCIGKAVKNPNASNDESHPASNPTEPAA